MRLLLTHSAPARRESAAPRRVLFHREDNGIWTRTAHYEYHSVSVKARRVPQAVLECYQATGASVVRWEGSRRKASPASVGDTYRSDDAQVLAQKGRV